MSGQIKVIGKAAAPKTAALGKVAENPAVKQARQLIDDAPNDPSGYLFLAQQLVFLGQPEAALPVIRRAVELDPINPNRYAFALALA